jgi:hypothetical protein
LIPFRPIYAHSFKIRGEELQMSATVEMKCPECDEPLRIPPSVFGKKIKCKFCQHAFVVKDPNPASKNKPGKPAKPGKPEDKPLAASPPPPPEPKKSTSWDDDEDAADVNLIEEEDVARCPHCAKELEPPEATVCIHCGFNNRTRHKAETKTVWAPDAMDWFQHLLPGLLALALMISAIVLDIISIMKMREWLTGTFLESDDTDASGRKKMYVAPGAFIFLIIFLSLAIIIPCAKYAFKRLAIEYRPTDQVKK